jgi:hypothetical protein
MPEAGHESVEEDHRGSVSEGLFRVHLRRLQLESSRRPLTFLQSASELADKTNCHMIGVNRQNHARRGPAARKCAPRVSSNAKNSSRCLPIVRLMRPIVSYIWLRNSVKTFVAVDYFIRARSQSVRQSLLPTSRSRPMRVSRGLSLCRDPSANAGAKDLVAPERVQAFHFFLRERFHRSVTVD